MENSLPPRNEEVTDEGHEAFKVKESVNFIIRAYDPEHELSEAKDTLKDKLEIDTINHNDEGITQQTKMLLLQLRTVNTFKHIR